MSDKDDFKPTTKQLRDYWSEAGATGEDALFMDGFDRWHAAEIRRAKVQALQEAAWDWEKLVQREKPPIRGALWMLKRAEEIEDSDE